MAPRHRTEKARMLHDRGGRAPLSRVDARLEVPMRLTLRTLLAYLDDTLTPSEARELGLKLAETPSAQELADRIKRVTRRRGLATPPVTGEGSPSDPNTVAEHLSDTLSPDQTAAYEKTS